jgi:transposase
MVAANARTAITFALSPGNAHDAPEGRELLRDLGSFPGMPVIMDRAYEGNETRQLVLELEMVPVVPPKSNRVDPWRYDRALYKKRNEIERLFRRLKVSVIFWPPCLVAVKRSSSICGSTSPLEELGWVLIWRLVRAGDATGRLRKSGRLSSRHGRRVCRLRLWRGSTE